MADPVFDCTRMWVSTFRISCRDQACPSMSAPSLCTRCTVKTLFGAMQTETRLETGIGEVGNKVKSFCFGGGG